MGNAVRDIQTVDSSGTPVKRLPHGLTFHEVPTHVDERGSVCEMFDPRWNWHPVPNVFTYMFTIRPGVIKGWGLHKEHEDRYFLLFGELEVTFYDVRLDSPTYGEVSQTLLTPYNRRIMNIPTHVWHACRNVGKEDCIVVNFPTIQYDHSNPDKYRLPLDTDEIPFKFNSGYGW